MNSKDYERVRKTSARTVTSSILTIAIIAMLMTGYLFTVHFYTPVIAVHNDNLFELGPGTGEGGLTNILGDGIAGNGPDWADIFNSTGGLVNLFGGVAAIFTIDQTSQSSATDSTTYSGAGGSNKNNDPLNTADCATFTPPLTGSACDAWHWDSGNVPAKDDLVNNYAWATLDSGGSLILYTGVERLAPEGDSHIDIEFFQSAVGLDELAPCNDPGPDPTPCNWTGIRTIGDFIISMDFVQGGALGEVTVRTWTGSAYSAPIVDLLAEGCNTAGGGLAADVFCAFNNGGNINGGPWPNFDRHGATITTIETNGFTEIGANVTAILGSAPCISTFLPKTRSSQSFTAELKDFGPPQSFDLCKANIAIGPSGVNEVGQEHTFKVNVTRTIAGSVQNAPNGTVVNVTFTPSATVVTDNCATGTVNGMCTVTITSSTATLIQAHAEANVPVPGGTKHVETDGLGGNSGDAFKRFVDAKISISPDAVNDLRVDNDHTFTVTVMQDDGNGAGFVASTVGHVDVTLTASGGATPTVNAGTSTCDDLGDNLDGSGQCTTNFTSGTTGTVKGSATVTLNKTFAEGVIILTRSTDGAGLNSGNATKRFVNATISINPDDTNSIGETHIFTVTVLQDVGDGSGLVAATVGHVDFSLSGSGGATPVLDTSASTCDNPGDNLDGSGQCTIVFTSPTAGTVTGHANVTLNLSFPEGNITLFRATGTSGNSGDAVKIFVSGSLAWRKVDNAGNLQGGATFEVCRTHNLNTETDTLEDITDVCVTVLDNSSPDENATAGAFLLSGLRLGRYTVDETVPPPGFEGDPSICVEVLTIAQPNAVCEEPFRNQRPILKLSEFGYINTPDGTPTSGVVSGTTTYRINLTNYGTATGLLNVTLTVGVVGGSLASGTFTYVGSTGGATSEPSGGASCVTGCTVSWIGLSVAAGASVLLTVTVHYDGVPDGTAIQADLTATYSVSPSDGLVRTASGSPATIKFTVQSD